jgi:hypothetical protein
MLTPKRRPMAPLTQADEDDANAKKTTDGTINTETDDDNADSNMMGDTLPYAQQTLSPNELPTAMLLNQILHKQTKLQPVKM